MDGRQVAVWCDDRAGPATLQYVSRTHGGISGAVELLSRFRTPRERARVVEDLPAGAVDIVIGTHRLLQEDIGFKDLGLVIIDEEQRLACCTRRSSSNCAGWWMCLR